MIFLPAGVNLLLILVIPSHPQFLLLLNQPKQIVIFSFSSSPHTSVSTTSTGLSIPEMDRILYFAAWTGLNT